MNKSILKEFSIDSRNNLMDRISLKIKMYYLNENFVETKNNEIIELKNNNHNLYLSESDYKKRHILKRRIEEIGYDKVVEEAAYTWFNRIIAIRYMEIHNYLPIGSNNEAINIRVLSSKDNKPDPEIIKFSNIVNNNYNLKIDEKKFLALENDNEKFKYILIKICNKLSEIFPSVFGGDNDYIDILIPDNMLSETGFVNKLITTVDEENFKEVEIIGWLYQYYNQAVKNEVMSQNRPKYKEEIPYVTQLFTPDWIVKYMVENSLVRFWLEHGGEKDFSNNFRYYLNQDIEKKEFIDPKNITFIDPCCGSGHILVYGFEVLYKIYESVGYNKKDIASLILNNNIYGLDIDDRAGQLSILSVLLKAREYDKDIFVKDVSKNLNIISIQESNSIDKTLIDSIPDDLKEEYEQLINSFENAKEIGSLMMLEQKDYNQLEKFILEDQTIFSFELKSKVLPLIKTSKILSNKYKIAVTNPPYMNTNAMSINLKKFVTKNYKDSKTDLCTAFMEVNFVEEDGYYSMINQHGWMFLSSFENLRSKIIEQKNIISMIHLGTRAFEEIGGEVVQTTSFVMQKKKKNIKTIFIRLVDYENAELKHKKFLDIKNSKENTYYIDVESMQNIPSYTFAYWIPEIFYNIFSQNPKISDYGNPKKGLSTGDNSKYLRMWHEVDINSIGFKLKKYEQPYIWIPINKGGEFRKWYGNNDYIVNWFDDGNVLKKFKGSVIRNENYYFKKSITWTMLSSKAFGVRASEEGKIFEGAGPSLFIDDNHMYNYVLGLMLSKIGSYVINMLNPTMNINIADISNIPIIYDKNSANRINEIVERCIEISKNDWDSYETSYGFKKHPLIEYKTNFSIKESFEKWNSHTIEYFEEIKTLEEELNRIFINIYGLNEYLDYSVDDSEITYRKANQNREIKSLISYIVGCSFGRYSIDKDGICCAGEKINFEDYKSFMPDKDNIIPIKEKNDVVFDDDLYEYIKRFVKCVFGEENFDINMSYIADILGRKGTQTSEEAIREYLKNNFYSDHLKIYQKKPIYWLIDSGKNNGFKSLIYIHRYNNQLLSKVRVEYLHKTQDYYERIKNEYNNNILHDNDIKKNQSIINNIAVKLDECNKFDEKIGHLANQMININLNDGITDNYEKFKEILNDIK